MKGKIGNKRLGALLTIDEFDSLKSYKVLGSSVDWKRITVDQFNDLVNHRLTEIERLIFMAHEK